MNKSETKLSWRFLPYTGAFIFASVGWLAGYPTIINPDVEIPFAVLVICTSILYWGIFIFARIRKLKKENVYWISIVWIIASVRIIPWISYDVLQN